MLFFRIVSLILLIQSGVEAAAFPSEEHILPSIQKSIITRMAAIAEARPYGEVLDRMQSAGALLIGSDDAEETSVGRAAVLMHFGRIIAMPN